MALLYGLLWRLLLVLVHMNRSFVCWLRARTRCFRGRLWERALASLLLPVAFTEFPVEQKKMQRNPDSKAAPADSPAERQAMFLNDGKSLEKLPLHIGLLVVDEEPCFTDVANLVVWCMAMGISHVSVYDDNGILQKNNSLLMHEITQLQRHLLGVEGSKVEFLSNGSEKHVVSCRPVVNVLSPEDGKPSIVQAAQQLCRSVENKERSAKDISVSMLDSLLREFRNISDPDLVLKLGPVDSTLGFLPWHIRLTEFISLSTHRNISYEDLLGALYRYGGCQQRLGK
ncbi:dehydrodolichyl diphosphate synthase complex subunit nus1 [Eucyclogobius newberryi]|uniref:dehydrodolichyl diphosphate synthase complex subunit nus1 n=1 Tax=Eucyclogobius newberryi TaxID=166745 RepID=UPI003B5C3A66